MDRGYKRREDTATRKRGDGEKRRRGDEDVDLEHKFWMWESARKADKKSPRLPVTRSPRLTFSRLLVPPSPHLSVPASQTTVALCRLFEQQAAFSLCRYSCLVLWRRVPDRQLEPGSFAARRSRQSCADSIRVCIALRVPLRSR